MGHLYHGKLLNNQRVEQKHVLHCRFMPIWSYGLTKHGMIVVFGPGHCVSHDVCPEHGVITPAA